VDERAWLTDTFEKHRLHLRSVAYRMLGSLAEADEAVQDTWVRISTADAEGVDNVGGWLTTIVARVCLNVLQARKTRPEQPGGVQLPEPIVTPDGRRDPEQEVLLADSVGLALQVVLETLPPSERLAFVLHDMFNVPFDEIAPMVGRSSEAARQLASRARRRVQGAAMPDPDLERQREVVNAFFAAARAGDFDALVAVLHPDVVLHSNGGEKRPKLSFTKRGAEEVSKASINGSNPHAVLRPVLVNGAAGVLIMIHDKAFAVMAFTVTDGRIREIDVVLDPVQLERLAFA
jgi:RNA polymerase sigma factor (sigma-70 family)